jgi:ABC-type polar amino acid transport system ATPase subunit
MTKETEQKIKDDAHWESNRLPELGDGFFIQEFKLCNGQTLVDKSAIAELEATVKELREALEQAKQSFEAIALQMLNPPDVLIFSAGQAQAAAAALAKGAK